MKSLLLIIFFFISISIYSYIESNDKRNSFEAYLTEAHKVEYKALSLAKKCDFSQTILVNIFNKTVAIPNLYSISPLPFKETRRSPSLATTILFIKDSRKTEHSVGSLTIGTYENELPSEILHKSKNFYVGEENISYHDLNVIQIKQKVNMYKTVIYNDIEYIRIHGTYKDFWKEIIDTSTAIEKNCKHT